MARIPKEWFEFSFECSEFSPSSLLTTVHHSLLPFIIPYYASSFPTALHHSVLPFIIYYYPSLFTTTLHHTLQPIASTATLHHSLQPISIHCYTSSFPHTIHHSLLPYIIPNYPSTFPTSLHHSLLPVIIHNYHSSFPITALHSSWIEKLLCFQQVHYSFLPFHSHSGSYQPAIQSSSMSGIEVRKKDIKIDINMY